MMEAAVVVSNAGEPLRWHLPPGRSAVSIPDTADLWTTLWEHRGNLAGVAHSHPGSGTPSPSREDVTTFAAIEQGLGRRLTWWITSQDTVIALTWAGPGKHVYQAWVVQDADASCRWLQQLRQHSYPEESP